MLVRRGKNHFLSLFLDKYQAKIPEEKDMGVLAHIFVNLQEWMWQKTQQQ